MVSFFKTQHGQNWNCVAVRRCWSLEKIGAPKPTCPSTWWCLPKVQVLLWVGFWACNCSHSEKLHFTIRNCFQNSFFANPTSGKAWAGPQGWATPYGCQQTRSPPTHTCSKDDISTNTGSRQQEKVASSTDATHTGASLHLQLELLCKLLPSYKGSFCLPPLSHLVPRRHSHLGSTILWKRADTIFPLSPSNLVTWRVPFCG